MNRRHFFQTAAASWLLPLSLLLPHSLPGQAAPAATVEDLTVLPALVDGGAPAALLETQLKKLAFAALDRRDAAYEQIKTPADVGAWQQRQRASFLAVLGGLPERTPLNARVTGQRDFGAYRLEKILFESQPSFIVSGLLYLPPGAGPPDAFCHSSIQATFMPSWAARIAAI